jgi:hypothetical protein
LTATPYVLPKENSWQWGQANKTTEKQKGPSGAKLKEEKSKFSEHMIAALCGYCKVLSPIDIPDA